MLQNICMLIRTRSGVYNLQRCRGWGRGGTGHRPGQSEHRAHPSAAPAPPTPSCPVSTSHSHSTQGVKPSAFSSPEITFLTRNLSLAGAAPVLGSVFIRGSFHAHGGTCSTMRCLRRRCKSRPIAQHVSECQTIPACLTTLP